MLVLDFYGLNLGWAKGFADILRDIVAPVNDIDFLTVTDFVHDSLDANTAATNKGTNWVDAWHRSGNCNLGAAASFAGNSLDFDGAIFDFWNLLAEEIFDKLWATTAKNKLCATFVAFNLFDEDLYAGTNGVEFASNLFGLWHNTSSLTEVNANNLWLYADDCAVYDSANLVFEHCEYGIAFCFAEALNYNLLCSLGCYAAKAANFMLFLDEFADFFAFCFGFWNLSGWVVGYVILDNFALNVNISLAGVQIELTANIHIFIAIILAPCGSNCLLDHVNYGLSW